MNLSGLLSLQERESGASIGIEALDSAFYLCASLRLHPDQYLHHSEFCRTAKLHGSIVRCSANKQRSIRVAQSGHSFCGRCPLGVWELARPVRFDGKIVCILYYGYPPRGGSSVPDPDAGHVARVRRQALFARDFINYELSDYQCRSESGRKQHDEAYYVAGCRAYIEQHYPENIGLAGLAEQLGVNPGYLGGYLKAHTGMTFRQLLTERRLQEAEVYLRLHPECSISKIAAMCGFSDSNYFSTVFRRRSGFSPRSSRR